MLNRNVEVTGTVHDIKFNVCKDVLELQGQNKQHSGLAPKCFGVNLYYHYNNMTTGKK